MVIRVLAYTLVILGLASLASSASAVTSTIIAEPMKSPLLKEGDTVECFDSQNCVHAALWHSEFMNNVRLKSGVQLTRPQLIELLPNKFIVALPDQSDRKQLFLVELDVETHRFSSKKTVTSKSTISPMVLSGE